MSMESAKCVVIAVYQIYSLKLDLLAVGRHHDIAKLPSRGYVGEESIYLAQTTMELGISGFVGRREGNLNSW